MLVYYCVVPENIHTHLKEGVGNFQGNRVQSGVVGGLKTFYYFLLRLVSIIWIMISTIALVTAITRKNVQQSLQS